MLLIRLKISVSPSPSKGDEMEPGEFVFVAEPRHPLHGLCGKIVGRRGARPPDDTWILVYLPARMRSFLIPESFLKPDIGGEKRSTLTSCVKT
jgi:hypothetical protein